MEYTDTPVSMGVRAANRRARRVTGSMDWMDDFGFWILD